MKLFSTFNSKQLFLNDYIAVSDLDCVFVGPVGRFHGQTNCILSCSALQKA